MWLWSPPRRWATLLSSSYSKDEGSEARRRPPQSLGLNPVSRLSARDPSLSEISLIFNLHCDWEKPPPSPPLPSPSPYLGVSLSPAQAAGSSHRWFSLSREKSGPRRSSAACSRSSLRGTDCSTDCRARSSSSGASSRDTSLRSDSAWAAMMPPPARTRQSTLPAPGALFQASRDLPGADSLPRVLAGPKRPGLHQ